MKKFDLGIVKTNLHPNGYIQGLVLNRDLTIKECRYIMLNILGIQINTRKDFDFSYDYADYNKGLIENVNEWLRGNIEDYVIMEYEYDCSNVPIGVMNLIPLIAYLKKRNIID